MDNKYQGIEDILNWCKRAGIEQTGSQTQFNLWKTLMLEELVEADVAFKNDDTQEQTDAVCDLIWIALNWAHMNKLDVVDLLKKVQSSNDSKFCYTMADAVKTVEAYNTGTHWDKPGVVVEADFRLSGDVYVITRKSDGKILKSLKYLAVKDL